MKVLLNTAGYVIVVMQSDNDIPLHIITILTSIVFFFLLELATKKKIVLVYLRQKRAIYCFTMYYCVTYLLLIGYMHLRKKCSI